jgi:hypothetical protein
MRPEQQRAPQSLADDAFAYKLTGGIVNPADRELSRAATKDTGPFYKATQTPPPGGRLHEDEAGLPRLHR